MKISETIQSTFGIALGTAGCYAAGYAYGMFIREDKTIAARAFALSVATKLTFDALTKLMTGGPKDDAKTFYTTHLVGDALFAALHILAFRHYNLIGHLGTAFLSFGACIICFDNLYGLKNA